MKKLIEALTIFAKYTDDDFPTGCEHDILYVYVDPKNVDTKDIETLDDIGFNANYGDYCFYSYRYGSA